MTDAARMAAIATWRVALNGQTVLYRVGRDLRFDDEGNQLPSWPFDGLVPLWGGRAWVAFVEDGWYFYETFADDKDVNPIPRLVGHVAYPVTPARVIQPPLSWGTVFRADEAYIVGGLGMADPGTNSVIVGPVVVMPDGDVRLLVLQAKQSGKTHSGDLHLDDFAQENAYRFDLPLLSDGPYRPQGIDGDARIRYGVSNRLERRVSAAVGPSLVAAVEFTGVTPDGGTAPFVSIVRQTLGSGVPFFWLEAVPDFGVMELGLLAVPEAVSSLDDVVPDGVADEVVGLPKIAAGVTLLPGHVGTAPSVGLPTIRMSQTRIVSLPGVPGGEVGFPTTMTRHVLKPAGVVGEVGDVTVDAATDLTVPGVNESAVGLPRIGHAVILDPPGVDDGTIGDVTSGTAAVVKPAGFAGGRVGRSKVRDVKTLIVEGIAGDAVGDVSMVAGGRLLDVPGVDYGAAGDVTASIRMTVKPAGVKDSKVGWPSVVPVTMVEPAGADWLVVGEPRIGPWGVVRPDPADESAVGDVTVLLSATVAPRGVTGGVARRPTIVAPSVGIGLVVPGIWPGVVGELGVGAAAVVDVPGAPGGDVGVAHLIREDTSLRLAVDGVDDGLVGEVKTGAVAVLTPPGVVAGPVGRPTIPGALLVDWRVLDVEGRWKGVGMTRWYEFVLSRWEEER